ncbi:MAG: 1-(5-phosphoribosyl)-5-[(5-phosphoribosylamino)methylideneamino]imidazole-4-carboxamide isomerase [Dysgonamonadaceae bacterium]|jgi:phosphoribosylformimino-5-aminoimidazole carboxamide ribotide isomerase|nr:1-(5-phosphoribosyl)-5-[(5-phosphoribosylamino)methylideneamino]imidazole-4-carboxamide isomerase [Dysgonamonadaceae bacterium]
MIEIIPAIDIIDGKCVRLSQGNYSLRKTYSENPVEIAKEFEDHGLRRLHVVDLDGAKANRIINHKTLENIATRTSLIIDFGGGVKSDADIEIAFQSGAEMVTGGSIAVRKPDIFLSWLKKYGPQKIILGADCKENKIAVTGWTEHTDTELMPFITHWRHQGVRRVICTDISKDGMLEGTNTELYAEIIAREPELFLIASGGVSSVRDIEILEEAHIHGVIIGKAIYEGRIALRNLLRFLEE